MAAILKIVISPYLSRELSEYDEIWYPDADFDPVDWNVRTFQIYPNSRWRTDAILKIIFGYNSAPYCPINTKFGFGKRNRTHTKVWWWKCQISKIKHGRRPSKFSTQTQILSQEAESWQKNQKFPNSRWRTDAILKIIFLAITRLHRLRLRRNLEFGGRIARTRRLGNESVQFRRPPFWKSLYFHISAANCPNCTKYSMQTQILPQDTETTKKKFANSKKTHKLARQTDN